MVKHSRIRLDDAFQALAHPARRQIVARLTRGPCRVSDLGERFAFSAPALTKHLRVLEHAGLLRQRREGRERLCHLLPRPMREVRRWIDSQTALWEETLDEMEERIGSRGR